MRGPVIPVIDVDREVAEPADARVPARPRSPCRARIVDPRIGELGPALLALEDGPCSRGSRSGH